jgi:phage-related protein (TIGR01555 family)
MFNKVITWMYRKLNPPAPSTPAPKSPRGKLSVQLYRTPEDMAEARAQQMQDMSARTIQRTIKDDTIMRTTYAADSAEPTHTKIAMDTIGGNFNVKSNFSPANTQYSIQEINWYAAQSFIGWQLCATLAQHWLIDKACSMPAKDAIRKGYEISANGDETVKPEVFEAIKQLNTSFEINRHLERFVKFNNVFGIRVALFNVDYGSPEKNTVAYEKPFNIDNVKANSYKGITQIDPYWITVQFTETAAANPADPHFYDPTWWVINGRKYHRSHLVIIRRSEVADVLKPTYYYGGIPLPQQLYERVYAAEVTANEAPMLVQTKRLTILKTDTEAAVMNPGSFIEHMQIMAQNRDNYGQRVIDKETEDMMQFDIALSDLDAVIMGQYQLVSAIAEVPGVKLLGTTPKGFNATGEFEEAVYHEKLSTIQTHEMEPLLQRHLLLLIRSHIFPKYGVEFTPTVSWNALDEETGKEKAEIQRFKAETDAILLDRQVILPEDALERIIKDPDSGYNGLAVEDRDPASFEPNEESFENDPASSEGESLAEAEEEPEEQAQSEEFAQKQFLNA